MIQYNNVSITYNGRKVISDFSLTIQAHEKVVLWGPSGSGKSSLMALLPGFHVASAGSVSVHGTVVNKNTINQVRKEIAWVPQEAALPFDTVREMIETPFLFRQNKTTELNKDLMFSYFDQLGLPESIYGKKMHEISGGENQRIMIVIAALLNKRVLLLDEPTSALDPASIEKLIAFIKNMKETTMLAVSHDRLFTESFDTQVRIG